MSNNVIINEILHLVDVRNLVRPNETPAFGEYLVCTYNGNENSDRMYYIGYVVQIRRGEGEFGSDIYLMRVMDGTLCTQEGQTFFRMTAEQRELAESVFVSKPSDEDVSKGYTILGTNPKTGFIV